jgi:hypothetical protein
MNKIFNLLKNKTFDGIKTNMIAVFGTVVSEVCDKYYLELIGENQNHSKKHQPLLQDSFKFWVQPETTESEYEEYYEMKADNYILRYFPIRELFCLILPKQEVKLTEMILENIEMNLNLVEIISPEIFFQSMKD